MTRKLTKAGRLHGNTKCQRCGCKNTDPLNRVRIDPATNAIRCDRCHTDVIVYGKPEVAA